jgi:hypothetical protein
MEIHRRALALLVAATLVGSSGSGAMVAATHRTDPANTITQAAAAAAAEPSAERPS